MRNNRLIALVVFVAAFVVLPGCGKAPAEAEPTAPPTPDPRPGELPKKSELGEPKYRITVKGILDEFATDRKAATAKYQDAVVELSATTTGHAFLGKTVWLTRDAPGYGYLWTLVFLEKLDGKFQGLGAYGRDLSVIGKVFTGQRVKIKGRLKVENSDSPPQLTEAEITEIGPDTSVRMTAAELAGAAKKDGAALDKRCKGKSLVVSGTVVGVVKKDLAEFIELKGDAGTKILCSLGLSDSLYDKGFQPGEKITFVGELSVLQPGAVYVGDCVPVNRLPK